MRGMRGGRRGPFAFWIGMSDEGRKGGVYSVTLFTVRLPKTRQHLVQGTITAKYILYQSAMGTISFEQTS